MTSATEENDNTLEIRTYPDAVLKTRSGAVREIDEDLVHLGERMLHTMYRAPGIGLAANQVGEVRRLIVFDQRPGEDERAPCILINPEIVEREGQIVYEEACLSVVDFSAEVTRSAQVLVRGIDPHEHPVELEAEGLLAICLQHEIDHLDGILYIDHLSSLKRAMYKKRLKKMLQKE